MKQLKFMIAAAAAIGLAGAAQADFPSETDKDALGNTGFEEFDAETVVTTGTTETGGVDSYFWYTGDVAADNESKIIAGQSGLAKAPRAKGAKFDDNANVLQVNTGTAPLLRTINRVTTNEGVSSAESVTVPATGIYIDTLVQFTVTPNGDSVTQTADDKLMIYLQETNTVDESGVVTSVATNLMVKCGKIISIDDGRDTVYQLDETPVDVELLGVAVEPKTWYRLTVKSQMVDGFLMFTAQINGTDLTVRNALGKDSANLKYLPSMIAATTLKAVGFAGEGLVDDIVFSTTQEELETSIDFTLSVVGATAVKAVIGENNEVEWAQGKFVLPAGTTTFEIKYTPATDATLWNPTYTAALSEAKSCTVNGLTVELVSANPSAKLTVTATEGTSAPTVDENADANSVGITTEAFSSDTGAALQKVVNWAVKAGLTKAELNAMPPFEETTGNATNTMQEAFLLNCALDEVATAKAAFKFPEIVPGVIPTVYEPDSGYNVEPKVYGADTIDGLKANTPATKDHKFFKAVLTK